MTTISMRWIAGLALLFGTAPIAAQQPTQRPTQQPVPGVQRITFADAIQIALKQNLSVRQIENNLKIQQAAASQARMNLLPDFSFNTSANDNVGQQFNLNTGKLSTQNTQTLSPGVGSSFIIYDASRTLSNIRSAQATATALSGDVSRTKQTAVFTVASDFVALVSAQSQLEVQQENLRALQAQLDQIQQFANAGARPISDLYQQRASVASAQLSVTQAERSVEVAKINLIEALQLDPAREYDFVAPPIPDMPLGRSFSLDSLVTIAYARRPDIAAAQSRVAAASQDVRGARSGRMPSLSARLGYSTAWTSASDSGIFNQFDQRRGGSVGLQFTLPIFDRGSVSLQEQRASITEENARLALRNQQQAVALDVRRALLDVRSAQQQLVAATAQQTAAQLALDAVQQRYNVGAATLLEITQARSQLVNAQSSLSTAKYNLVLTQAVLSYYTGELDPNNVRLGTG
jgi:outer membrane protein